MAITLDDSPYYNTGIYRHEEVPAIGEVSPLAPSARPRPTEAPAGYEEQDPITIKPFDYGEIGSTIKSYAGTTGRAISGGVVEEAIRGGIESQLGAYTAVAEEEAERRAVGEEAAANRLATWTELEAARSATWTESEAGRQAAWKESELARQTHEAEAAESRNLQRDALALSQYGIDIDATLALEQMQLEEEANEAAGKAARGAAVGAGIGTAVGYVYGGPVGALVGASVGSAIGGAIGGASVLCTELHEQGYISSRDLAKTHIFRKKYIRKVDSGMEIYLGYLMWATPVVKVMRKSRLVTQIVRAIWMPVIHHMLGHKTWRGKTTFNLLSKFSLGVFKSKKEVLSYG